MHFFFCKTDKVRRYVVCAMLVWCTLAFVTPAHAIELSDSSQVTLLTCAPGSELYSAFGHTGIRVTDFSNGFDVVFNYGTFNFAQPGFYTNFVRGKMLYMLSVDRYEDFRDQYIYEERRVDELVLDIEAKDRKKIFAFLYENAKPENRDYRYDFFWDNCATRPRDVFEKTLGNRLQYNYSVLDSTKTMRQTLHEYVWNRPWVALGFDLILGLPCDIKATPRHQMFLPDRLQTLFASAQLDGRPLVKENRVVLDLPSAVKPYQGITPIAITFGFLVAGLLMGFWERFRQMHFWKADATLFVFTGLLGLFFLAMWAFTEHYSTPKNLNVLWLLPTHLVAGFFLFKKQKPSWLIWYFGFTAVWTILLLATWKWNPQPYNLAVLPWMLLLANRALRIVVSLKLEAHARASS